MQPPIIPGLTETTSPANLLALLAQQAMRGSRRSAPRDEARPHSPAQDPAPKIGSMAGANIKTPI